MVTPDDLDFYSKLTIECLLNRGGEATAGYLREQVGVEQTNQIHYRVENYLDPIGFVVDTSETTEYKGNESKIYRLTDEGEEYALQMNLDLAPELHRGQLEREFEQLLANMEAIQEHAEGANSRAVAAHSRIDKVKNTVDGWDGQMDALQSDVDRVDGRLDRLNALLSDEALDQRVEELEERVKRLERLEARLESVENSLEQLWEIIGRGKWNDEFTLFDWSKWVSRQLKDGNPDGSEQTESEESGGWLLS